MMKYPVCEEHEKWGEGRREGEWKERRRKEGEWRKGKKEDVGEEKENVHVCNVGRCVWWRW